MRALRARSQAKPTEAAAEPMAKNPPWKYTMTPSVVMPGMSTLMTGTPPSCPGVATVCFRVC
jgi:hypothetical protein